jgi:hypothetical protein
MEKLQINWPNNQVKRIASHWQFFQFALQILSQKPSLLATAYLGVERLYSGFYLSSFEILDRPFLAGLRDSRKTEFDPSRTISKSDSMAAI